MAMASLDVYTTGGIEYLTQVYKGLVMTIGDSAFDSLVRVFSVWGLIVASFYLVLGNKLQLFMTHLLGSFLLFNIFFTLKADVTIQDTKFNQTYVVSNVPLGPAFVSSLFSTTSYYITKLSQNAFHTGTVSVWDPLSASGDNAWASANLDYSSTGFGGFFDYLAIMQKMEFNGIANKDVIRFDAMVNAYLYQCTMNEIAVEDKIQIQTRFYDTNSLMEAITPSFNQFMNYDGLTTCKDFYDGTDGKDYGFGVGGGLYKAWTDTIKPLFDGNGDGKILAFLNIPHGIMPTVQAAVSTAVGDSAQSLGDMIGQAGMFHAMDGAYLKYVSDSPNASQYMALLYGTGTAMQQAGQTGKSLGLYAKEVVPMLRIAFESLFIALLPLFALIIYIPRNLTVLKGFTMSVAWIYMWDPVLAAINGLVNISAIARLHTALEAANATGGLNLTSYNAMLQTIDFIPAVAGYLGLSTPGIALMLIKGGEMTVSHIMGMMGSPVTAAPMHQRVADEIETEKIAERTGQGWGSIDYASHAQGGAKITAMAFQRGQKEIGYDNLLQSESNLTANRFGSGSGYGDTSRAHDVGMKGTQLSSAGLEGQYEGYGGDMNLAKQVSAINTQSGAGNALGTQDTANRAAGGNVSGLSRSMTAKQQGISLADMNSTLSAFGTLDNYENFQNVSKGLSLSRQEGLASAARASGVNLFDMTATSSFVDGMKQTGIYNEYAKGNISNDELARLGATGILTEVGRSNAAQNLAKTFGGDVKHYQEQLGTWQGANEYLKFDTMQKFTNHLNSKLPADKQINIQDVMRSRHSSWSGTISKEWSQALGIGNRDMQANVGFMPDGSGGMKVVFSDQHSGKQFAHGTFGRSGHDIRQQNIDLQETEKGSKTWKGSSNIYENTNQSIGLYKGSDGQWYSGNFQWAKGEDGRHTLVSGSGSNVASYNYADTQKTPDGKSISTVRNSTYSQNNQLLNSSGSSGNKFTYDNSKTFSGGYKYDNYISATAEEQGGERMSQATGRVQGLIVDVGRYVPQSLLKNSTAKPKSNPGVQDP